MQNSPLLTVNNLTLGFRKQHEINTVLHNITFSVFPNEILGIVGESGSGKSVTNLAVLGLLPKRNTDIKSGEILFEGKSLLTKNEKELQKIRGNEISMIFQEPMTSLNPVYTCGDQVMEAILLHDADLEKASKLIRGLDPIVKFVVNGFVCLNSILGDKVGALVIGSALPKDAREFQKSILLTGSNYESGFSRFF